MALVFGPSGDIFSRWPSTEIEMATSKIQQLTATLQDKINTINSAFDGEKFHIVIHNGKSKVKIKTNIGFDKQYSRQAFLLFSCAGGNEGAITVMQVSVESLEKYVAAYRNAVGTMVTATSVYVEDKVVVGEFTVGGRYDYSVIIGPNTATITSVD